MNKYLVCLIRVNDEVVYLIALKFLVGDFKMIFRHYVTIADRNVPNGDPAERITYKKAVAVTENEAVWMYFIKNRTFDRRLYFLLRAICCNLVVRYLYFRLWL
jgi:hypothetical protein